MSSALGSLTRLLSNQGKVALLLLGHDDTTIEFAVPLTQLSLCSTSLANVGRPPTSRTRDVHTVLKRACRHFKASATLFARGVDNRNSTTINAAARELGLGAGQIKKATSMISRFR